MVSLFTRYPGDFKNRDHYRNYPRDDGNFQRGKPHRNDFPYSQDRHNNRYFHIKLW